MSTKSKSALSETPNSKSSPGAPRITKTTRGLAKSNADSVSPVPNARLSSERSPVSVTKPIRSPKLATPTPPEKKATRVASKSSELQAEITQAQEDLKKAKEKLVLVEKEKDQALDELKKAQASADEANEKLREALVAQKRAQEDSEIEKFRSLEMEQAGIEVTQQRQDEWQKELESIRNQHALDVAALLSATEELQKVKQELVMTSDAKNQALAHADDATKIAEINAEKVDSISAELASLKSALDSKVEKEACENEEKAQKLKSEIDSLRLELEEANGFEEKFVQNEAALEKLHEEAKKLNLEIDSVRNELEEAKGYKGKLAEKEAILEQLHVDLEAAKMAETYARNLAEELDERVNELASQAEHAKRLERSASESLESVMIQLRGSNNALHKSESDISLLKQKVNLLEISIERQKRDLEESETLLELAKEESSDMAKKIKSLTSELESANEEKTQALSQEKLAADSIQMLLEEKNKLVIDLEASRIEDEKSKKALESLSEALHEVSVEAREGKEKLSSFHVEHENYEMEIENLKLVLKATNEKYEKMLDDAKKELDALSSSVESSKNDHHNLKAEWEKKEIHWTEKSNEEISFMENEIKRLIQLLKTADEQAAVAKDEDNRRESSLKESESEVVYLKEILGEAKSESMKLIEDLIEKEKELRDVIHENEELRKKEEESVTKVQELSKLLEQALSKKNKEDENGDLTDCEKEYDMLEKVVEFPEENGSLHVKPNEVIAIISNDQHFEKSFEADKPIEKLEVNGEKEKDSEFKMWESCKIEEKDFSPEDEEHGEESFEDDRESSKSKVGDSDEKSNKSPEIFEKSPAEESNSQKKKKKALLSKFGSLLKKRGTSATQK